MPTNPIDKTNLAQSTEDGDSLHTLHILDEISKGNPITQRELSSKLGITLGMINRYLKRLARKGYIDITKAGGKKLHYLLTPKGITEKSFLLYRHIKKSFQIYTRAQKRMLQFFEELQNEGVKTIVLYPPTPVAEIAILVLHDSPINLVCIVDKNKGKDSFLGYRIISLDDLQGVEFNKLLITSEDSVEKVVKELEPYGVERKKICSFQ